LGKKLVIALILLDFHYAIALSAVAAERHLVAALSIDVGKRRRRGFDQRQPTPTL
jgi:hypothetical protein